MEKLEMIENPQEKSEEIKRALIKEIQGVVASLTPESGAEDYEMVRARVTEAGKRALDKLAEAWGQAK